MRKERISLDDINNYALREELKDLYEKGILEETVDCVFEHVYTGGQGNWGIMYKDGATFAWFGGDYPEEIDNIDDLGVMDWYEVDEIDF